MNRQISRRILTKGDDNNERTIIMNSIDSIYNDLFELGVRNGDILLVHTSLSSLGWVCGGAQAVLMALKQVVGKSGTLVMPSHSGVQAFILLSDIG
jgi:aminoglycoside 3-N-acetyltransferase